MEQRNGSMEFNYLQRVKVYRLNDDGKWDDKGTGHVSVEYLERSDAVGLVVIDEEDNATLLVHRISADDIYQRQEDTIISWTDPEVATDLALSFQETMGCAYIWDQICNVQRQIQFPSVSALDPSSTAATARQGPDDHQDHSSDDALPEGSCNEFVELPAASLNNLPQIAKMICEVSPFQRDRTASLVLRDQNYVKKLVDLFRDSEELENMEGLHHLYRLFRGLILLNDGHLFDVIFSEEYIMDVVGALEYDPDLPVRQDHRKYLRETVVFKEAVPITTPAVLSKIHQTYKIGYIKDVILPRVLDDQTLGTLNSLILFNNVEVVTALQNDRPFVLELFLRLRTRFTTDPSWRDLVMFLQEFCSLHKHLQPPQRNQSFSSLISAGLFDIVTSTLQHPSEDIRLSGADILMATLSPDPGALRAFLVEQPRHTLFGLLVRGLLTPSQGGLQVQLLEIMRMLLDSDTMEVCGRLAKPWATPNMGAEQQGEKSKFLDVFYEEYIDQLVGALALGCPGPPTAGPVPQLEGLGGPLPGSAITPEVLSNICELLCFCVQHHSFRIKYYVLRNNVVEKVLRLTRRRERYLVLAAVRFLRTCVSLKDEFYCRYLVKNRLFEPVIEAFLANGDRYNLLNSAVIEMVDFIRKEGIKSLVTHLVETYGARLAAVDYVQTFQLLRIKYDQAMEGAGTGEAPSPEVNRAVAGGAAGEDTGAGARRGPRFTLLGTNAAPRRHPQELHERGLDDDEEHYFKEDSDDEEDTASAPEAQTMTPLVVNGVTRADPPLRSSALGLVDYEDEDDDGAPPGPAGSGDMVDSPRVPVKRHAESRVWSNPLVGKRRHTDQISEQPAGRPWDTGLDDLEGGGGAGAPGEDFGSKHGAPRPGKKLTVADADHGSRGSRGHLADEDSSFPPSTAGAKVEGEARVQSSKPHDSEGQSSEKVCISREVDIVLSSGQSTPLAGGGDANLGPLQGEVRLTSSPAPEMFPVR